MISRKLLILIILASLVSTIVPARAENLTGKSDWQGAEAGRIRLVAGATDNSGIHNAGVEIKLADGWKTYWRSPGDSGVPPVFDWSDSKNLKSAGVQYPAPIRFKDDYGMSVGYKHEVVFPLLITPENPAKPVDLQLTIQYGVCREVCIPGEATLSLLLMPGGVPLNQPIIERFRKRVPVNSVSGLEIAGISLGNTDDKVSVNVTLEHKEKAPVELFVEGPLAYYFETPKPVSGAPPGTLRFQVTVDGAKDRSELRGKTIRVTAVQGKLSLEKTHILE